MSHTEDEAQEDTYPEEELWDADPDCDHEIIEKWSGIVCSKCKGWFCY